MKRQILGLLTTFLFTGLAQAQLAPLPVGNTGLASKYSNDVGIGADPNVIFSDDFESYTGTSQLTTKWSSYYQSSNTRIATEAGNFFGGAKALEMTLPQVSQEVSNAVVKNLSTTQDVLFVRIYTKFDPGYDVNVSSNHNGIRISAKYPGPGRIPSGSDFFLYLMENAIDYGEADPGYTRLYTYHPEQRSQWGDIFYPNGKVLPIDGVPGDFGPYFVSRPNFIPQRGRWYSYELMVKANTPGQRDGRAAMWIDGNLVADFPNLRMRDISTLKIDQIQLELHSQSGGSLNRQNKKYYDNVVVAKSYIGPVQSGTPPPPPPPPSLAAPTNLRVVSVAYNQVKLQFDDSNSTESGFQVHRKIGSSGTLSQIGTTAAQSYDDNSVSSSTQYCYQVKAYDSSSVSASSNEICATTAAAPAANVAPNVSITSPANGSSFSAGMSVAINASASDSDGSVSKVEFFSGSTKLGEDLTSPYSLTMSNVAAGSYSLTARATDNLGATRTSVAVSITVSSVTEPPPANVGPSVSITSPSNGASFSAGMSIAINANASDSDGSVSKVEFFNGSTKLGEDLSAPYSLTMSNVAAGSYSLSARATDNAGAIANSAAVSITVNAVTQPPPSGTSVTLLTSQVPAQVNLNDGVSYELGMRFTSTAAGKIMAIRFLKASSETGTHTGKIYSSSGALLASVVFSGETAAGWQQMNLASPLSIAANTEYTVSVNTGAGYYVATNNGMASQISNGSLRSVVGNNGVYGSVGSRPTNSYESSNYFRDIVFVADSGSTTPPPPTADTQAPVASIVSPVNGALVKAGSVITISASASDNVGVSRVEIYTNGNLRCTKTAAPYSCNWTVPKRVGRTHQIQVKAYDAAGNVGSQTISVKSN